MTPLPVPSPVPPPAESVEERFGRLAAQWHKAVAHHSSTTLRTNHPAYQEIIALGPAVLPAMLRDLEAKHPHWFAALRAITGADPVPPAAAGNVPEMAAAWLAWARGRGYRW